MGSEPVVHASVELLEAMQGIAPPNGPVGAGSATLCGALTRSGNWAGAYRGTIAGYRSATQAPEVTCPECLRLIRSSLDAESLMRIDYLLERKGAA